MMESSDSSLLERLKSLDHIDKLISTYTHVHVHYPLRCLQVLPYKLVLVVLAVTSLGQPEQVQKKNALNLLDLDVYIVFMYYMNTV